MKDILNAIVVQIRSPDYRKLAGAGFIVHIDGIIATCLHVIKDSEVSPKEGARVGICLGNASERFSGTVVSILESDDIVLLQLDQVLPYGWSSASLGASTDSYGHNFISKGYPKLGRYIGSRAEGHILWAYESIDGLPSPQFSLMQLSSQQIEEGMSGAPVLDMETNMVVGIITEFWVPQKGLRNRDTAFASPSEALILAFPQKLRLMPTPSSTEVTSQLVDDISQLIRLSGYRILGNLHSETDLLYECEASESGQIRRVLISIVKGEPQPADMMRLNQTMATNKIAQGIILSMGEKSNGSI